MSINRTIKTLGVAKSTVYYKPKEYPDRKRTARKALCEQMKAAILELTVSKSTYGVPRVKASYRSNSGRGFQHPLGKRHYFD
ncbi:hypothetical protein [Echinicola pacifica]|uniref:hypothetical protein n=1 Tax=Echinicola pacifica TaxID=346377 RepID=UPI0014614523|nr:hypothetical protein [Echinicola pacifica]